MGLASRRYTQKSEEGFQRTTIGVVRLWGVWKRKSGRVDERKYERLTYQTMKDELGLGLVPVVERKTWYNVLCLQ